MGKKIKRKYDIIMFALLFALLLDICLVGFSFVYLWNVQILSALVWIMLIIIMMMRWVSGYRGD